METTKTKLMIPDRAIASVVFGFLSHFSFMVYCRLLWGTHDQTKDGMEAIGSIMGSLETTRRVLAVAALLWCLRSWQKEWWLPATLATILTGLILFEAFLIDS